MGTRLSHVSVNDSINTPVRLLRYLSILMTILYKLGFTSVTKDRFRSQSDLGDLETNLEVDTIELYLTGSRDRHRRRRGPKYAHVSGGPEGRPGYVGAHRKRVRGPG